MPVSIRSCLTAENESTTTDEPKESAVSTGGSENVVASSLLENQISKHRLSLAEFENEDPIIKEVRETYAALGFFRNKYDVRITDGSYVVTNAVTEDKDDGFVDEEGAGGKKAEENKPHIDTMASSNRMLQLSKRLARGCKTGDFSSGTKMEETIIMEGVNLRLESGKMYLVLGAPGESSVVMYEGHGCHLEISILMIIAPFPLISRVSASSILSCSSGCGKSTLLKMIAQNLRVGKDQAFNGNISINGCDKDAKPLYWTNLVGYVDQIDRLHSLLTVKETCDFAFKCRLGSHRRDAMPKDDPAVEELLKKMDDEDWLVMTLLKAMGLEYVKDTFVGDDSKVRGVSGGQRKRVTVSEMTSIGTPIICYDEMSTGLDAATTYDITRLMGQAARMGNTIKAVSLLQPPPETVALFDEIILLDRGRVIFAGPIDEVVGHFTSLGYQIPERMDPADWLQTLPTPDGAQFLADKTKPHLTNKELVEKFEKSERGQLLETSLKAPLADILEPVEGEKEYTQRFHNSWWTSTVLVFRREALLWWRDKYQLKARIMQDLIMGIVVGTVFWQVQDNPQSCRRCSLPVPILHFNGE